MDLLSPTTTLISPSHSCRSVADKMVRGRRWSHWFPKSVKRTLTGLSWACSFCFEAKTPLKSDIPNQWLHIIQKCVKVPYHPHRCGYNWLAASPDENNWNYILLQHAPLSLVTWAQTREAKHHTRHLSGDKRRRFVTSPLQQLGLLIIHGQGTGSKWCLPSQFRMCSIIILFCLFWEHTLHFRLIHSQAG